MMLLHELAVPNGNMTGAILHIKWRTNSGGTWQVGVGYVILVVGNLMKGISYD